MTLLLRRVPGNVGVRTWNRNYIIQMDIIVYPCTESQLIPEKVGPLNLSEIFSTANEYWGRVTLICVGKLIITGSDNGLSPDRRQAIIWTNAGLLSIGPLRTYFSENLVKKTTIFIEKMHVKMSSAKWRPSCLGLNVLTIYVHVTECSDNFETRPNVHAHGAIRFDDVKIEDQCKARCLVEDECKAVDWK